MNTFFKQAALAALVLTSLAALADIPAARAQGYLSTQPAGPSQAACGKKRCISLKNGKWTITKR